MRKSLPNLLAIIMICFLSSCNQSIQQATATDVSDLSVNHLNFSDPISDKFTFIVYGHSYGTALEADEYPSITLRSHLDEILAMDPDMIISLGDMVENPIPQQFSDLETMLLSRYDVPVFNAVGNHDVDNRELYESLYGAETYYSFKYANAMFIVLDTEINHCFIKYDQLEKLQTWIGQALTDESIDTIYIMMHKVLYMDKYLMEQNETNMVLTNDLKIFEGNNFTEIIDSLLMPAARSKPVHIFAGDVGAFNGNLSPYYQKDRRANLYMYASGLGDSENDVVLVVTNNKKDVTVTPYVLETGKKLDITDYDENYWRYYGRDRWEKYRSEIDFGKECLVGVCRVGKDVFHMQCRYFILIIVFLIAGLITGMTYLLRKKKKQAKAIQ